MRWQPTQALFIDGVPALFGTAPTHPGLMAKITEVYGDRAAEREWIGTYPLSGGELTDSLAKAEELRPIVDAWYIG